MEKNTSDRSAGTKAKEKQGVMLERQKYTA